MTGDEGEAEGGGVVPVGAPGQELTDFIAASGVPVLVDYRADWCAPCRRMDPVVAEVAREYAGRARVVSVDVDAHPGEARRSRVASIPTFVVFSQGHEVGRVVGARPKKELRALLDAALAN